MTAVQTEQDQSVTRATVDARKIPPLVTLRDITSTPTFKDVWRRHEEFLLPSQNIPVDFENPAISPDGKRIAGVATICKELKGRPSNRLAIVDVENGQLSTFGEREGSDSRPHWSPSGETVCFLSLVDGASQLHLLDVASGGVKLAGKVPGNIEELSWSKEGAQILLVVAGFGADLAGYQGGQAMFKDPGAVASWMPAIDKKPATDAYRTAWIYDVSSGISRRTTSETLNIWQAVWASSDSIVGFCSDKPGEDNWYHSTLREISLATGEVKELFATDVSMEWLAASPGGEHVAFAVGVASDRGILTGDLHVLEVASGRVILIDALGVNVGAITWAGNDDVVAAGLRDGKEVIIQYNIKSGEVSELWSSDELSLGSAYRSELTACKGSQIFVTFVQSGYFTPPTLVISSASGTQEIKAFSSPELHKKTQALGQARKLQWMAPDGMTIYGYLLSPSTTGPFPTLMNVHGGPVYGWTPRYIGKAVQLQALLAAGFAVFEPNPRGSWGRGQSFARAVFGDMGGADTQDYLSGLDAIIDAGVADPNRLGVFGGSYGGFMSSWLISQSDRFAAAMPMSPVTNWTSEHFTCNIMRFCRDFLADDVHNPTGQYFSRSPIHHVKNVKTPTLLTCGTLDQTTPAGQAIEFHHALLEQGVPSVLLTYPEEGHGVKNLPAFVDLVARQVEWFRAFLS
ncbi:alpha/beta-hydrolase [Thozetella sp. PMI_491]|nr:alpha/beta-hydrolase [Thozetella sp. PMI_491]